MEFDNSRPIWMQLVAEFSRRIAIGKWQPGARIEGVRDLAVVLGVNPNTVQRSFSELEREGLVRSERTAGRFVTDDQELITRMRRQLAAAAADEFIRKGHGVGMQLADAIQLLEERWSNDDDDH